MGNKISGANQGPTTTMRNATSALKAAQTQIATVSQNIAASEVPGYSAKYHQPYSISSGGVSAGVGLSPVLRVVDEALTNKVRAFASQSGVLESQQQYLQRLSESLGTVRDGNSIFDNLSRFQTGLNALSVTPNNDGARKTLLESASNLTKSFRDGSEAIQTIREDVSHDILTTVTKINDILAQIHTTSTLIYQAGATTSTANLEDDLDKWIKELSTHISVQIGNDSGRPIISTKGGIILYSRQVYPLTYDKPARITASQSYPAGVPGIFVGSGKGIVDITKDIGSGRLAGLVELRDKILPNRQKQLDALASQIKDGVNAIHNKGTIYPPTTQFLSTTGTFVNATPITASGRLRVAIVNTDGLINNVAAVNPSVIDVDISACADIQSLITTFNNAATAAGYNANVAMQLNGGNLQIYMPTPIAGAGLAIGDVSGQGYPTINGLGFQHFFGFNDFFVTNKAVNLSNIGLDTPVASSHIGTNTFALGGATALGAVEDMKGTLKISLVDPNGNPFGASATMSLGGKNTLAQFITDFNNAFISLGITATLNGSNKVDITSATPNSFIALQQDGDKPMPSIDGQTFWSYFGYPDQSTSAANFYVSPNILGNTKLIATGVLNNNPSLGTSTSNDLNKGITESDNVIMNNLKIFIENPLPFLELGDLSGSKVSPINYAANILSTNAILVDNKKVVFERIENLYQELTANLENFQGVNRDEEFAKLLSLQAQYSANAHVIFVCKELLDEFAKKL